VLAPEKKGKEKGKEKRKEKGKKRRKGEGARNSEKWLGMVAVMSSRIKDLDPKGNIRYLRGISNWRAMRIVSWLTSPRATETFSSSKPEK